MIRKLVILWLSLSLVSSLIGGAAKIARHFDDEADMIHMLTNQVAALDQELNGVEEKLGKQPALRTDLVKIRAEIVQLAGRNSEEQNWNWFEDVLQPIFFIAFLWLLFRNKDLLTEQTDAGNRRSAGA